jgi:hypothetical protein
MNPCLHCLISVEDPVSIDLSSFPSVRHDDVSGLDQLSLDDLFGEEAATT